MYKQLRKKRLEIIYEIDSKIKLCECTDAYKIEGCKNCEEIKSLGEKLSGLKENSGNKSLDFYVVPRKERTSTPFHLEVDEYKKLKERGKSDLEIARMFDGNAAQIRYWKEKNKLINMNIEKKVIRKKVFEMTVEEYESLRDQGLLDYQIAKAKNVAPSRIQRWKAQNDIENLPLSIIKFDLTTDDYWALHKSGVTDAEIARNNDVSKCYLSRWKKMNGIITKKWSKKQTQGVN